MSSNFSFFYFQILFTFKHRSNFAQRVFFFSFLLLLRKILFIFFCVSSLHRFLWASKSGVASLVVSLLKNLVFSIKGIIGWGFIAFYLLLCLELFFHFLLEFFSSRSQKKIVLAVVPLLENRILTADNCSLPKKTFTRWKSSEYRL